MGNCHVAMHIVAPAILEGGLNEGSANTYTKHTTCSQHIQAAWGNARRIFDRLPLDSQFVDVDPPRRTSPEAPPNGAQAPAAS